MSQWQCINTKCCTPRMNVQPLPTKQLIIYLRFFMNHPISRNYSRLGLGIVGEDALQAHSQPQFLGAREEEIFFWGGGAMNKFWGNCIPDSPWLHDVTTGSLGCSCPKICSLSPSPQTCPMLFLSPNQHRRSTRQGGTRANLKLKYVTSVLLSRGTWKSVYLYAAQNMAKL